MWRVRSVFDTFNQIDSTVGKHVLLCPVLVLLFFPASFSASLLVLPVCVLPSS